MNSSKLSEIDKIAWKSEEELSSLLNDIPVCIAYFDKEQRYEFINKTYQERFGISFNDIRGKHIREVLGEKVYDSVRGHIAKALSGKNVGYQAALPDKDGKTKKAAVNLIPRFDNNGDVKGCFLHAEDITGNKIEQERLLESEARFRTLFDNGPEAMVVIDVDVGKFMDANPKALQLFGFTRDEFIGLGPLDISPPFQPDGRFSKDAVEEKIWELIKNDPKPFEWVHKNSSGQEILCEIRPSRLPSADRNLFCGIAIDITKSKQVEMKLKASEERLRSFMDNSPAWIYIKDGSYRHIYGNKSLLNALNLKLHDFIGTTSHDFMPEDVANRIINYDREVMEKGVPIESDEYNFETDREFHHIWEIKFPVNLYSGEMGVGGIVMDITELKQKEESLQKAYDEIKLLKDQLKKENIYLREEIRNEHQFREIIGRSDAMQDVLKKAEQVAATDSTVLIVGETGTGKELVARAIHDLSMRKDRTMVKVNCAALPSTLIESELFGREKGAYTGAIARQAGRFEVANGSTIFLDEIGELSPELQVKLLRVLQDGEFERLGSSRTMKVDARVIAATNRDLEKSVRYGTFREDLYYRLKVFPIYILPLRERTEDIPPLVWSIVKELGNTMGKRIEDVKKTDMDALQRYHWPGNVRELRNMLEQAMILSKGKTLNIQIPKLSQKRPPSHRKLEDAERDHILSVLEKTRWRVSGKNGAADILGLKESTLRARMKKLGIKRPR